MTYGEAQVIIDKVGSAIVTLGLAPVNDTQVRRHACGARQRARPQRAGPLCYGGGGSRLPRFWCFAA